MRMSSNYTVSIQSLLLIMASTERKMTSEMISQSTGANPVLIRQLFTKLKKADILSVSTGLGVTTLSRDPKDISLWDIYMAIEKYDAADLFKFHPNISPECKIGGFFKDILTPHLDEAIQAMAKEMAQISLFQLWGEWQSKLNESE